MPQGLYYEIEAGSNKDSAARNSLSLRNDEVMSGTFLIGLALALASIAVGLPLLAKLLRKLNLPNHILRILNKEKQIIQLMGTFRTSRKVTISLVDIDGIRAAILESAQGASLTLMPSSRHTTTENDDGKKKNKTC